MSTSTYQFQVQLVEEAQTEQPDRKRNSPQRPHLTVHAAEAKDGISISIDHPIEVLSGNVTTQIWNFLFPYILRNHELLLSYWEGAVRPQQYAKEQKPYCVFTLVQDKATNFWRVAKTHG